MKHNIMDWKRKVETQSMQLPFQRRGGKFRGGSGKRIGKERKGERERRWRETEEEETGK